MSDQESSIEPISDVLLMYGVPIITGASLLVNFWTLLLHHHSLQAALRTLFNMYRILDSQPRVWVILTLLALVFFWHQPPLAFVIPVYKMIAYVCLISVDLQLCFVAFLAEGAFKALYKRIKEHYKLLVQTSEDGGPLLYFDEPCLKLGKRPTVDLYELRQIHRQLHHVMSTVNQAYNLAALVITVSCRFLFTIYLYRWIVSKFLTPQLVYALLTLQRLFYICYRFEALKRVEKSTADIINGLDKSPLDAKSRAEFKLFLIQLKSHRLVFNSIQMFDLDFSLITSVFTTTITYLMLLQQFT